MTKGLRDFANALFIAILSIGLMVGALSISLVEFGPEAAATETTSSPLLPSPSPIIIASSTITPTTTSIATMTIPASPTALPVSDTPTATGTTTASPVPTNTNIVLNVPLGATSTSAGCVQGASGWKKNYVVKTGDTIYAIASNYNTTATQLKTVNCRTSDLIYSGEILWVPNNPTRTPSPTLKPGATTTIIPTEPFTQTALPFTLTVLPSSTTIPTTTPIPTWTASPTVIP